MKRVMRPNLDLEIEVKNNEKSSRRVADALRRMSVLIETPEVEFLTNCALRRWGRETLNLYY